MSETNKQWYVLRTITGHEKKIKQHIESEVLSRGLEEFVSQVLVPIEKVFQIRNGKKISKEKNKYSKFLILGTVYKNKKAAF